VKQEADLKLQQPSIVVVISGSGTNLQAIIDACVSGDLDVDISAVISNVPGVYGLERAQKAGIEALTLDHKKFQSRDDYDIALAKEVHTRHPDLVVLAGFMRILTPKFVNHFHGKILNIHPSLLPKYQGYTPASYRGRGPRTRSNGTLCFSRVGWWSANYSRNCAYS